MTLVPYARHEMVEGWPDLCVAVNSLSTSPLWVCRQPGHAFRLDVQGRSWEAVAAPPALRREDFVRVEPGEGVDLFRLPIRPLPGTSRSFSIGATHRLDGLPPSFEFSYVYRLSEEARRFAAAQEIAPVFNGEAPPGSSPNALLLLDNAQVLERIAAGEFNANLYVKPRDATFLAGLEPLLGSEQKDVRREAMRALVATQLPEAALRLVRFCREQERDQLRGEALHGFRELHPASILPELIALAAEEVDGVYLGSLLRSIGEIGGAAALAALRARKVPEAGHALDRSAEFDWLFARIRCADREAVDVLLPKLRALDAGHLERCLADLSEARNLDLAKGLTGFFDDVREVFCGPCITGPPGHHQEYLDPFNFAIRDLALAAVTAMFPETPWGFNPEPRRRYAPAEFAHVKRVLGS